MNDRWREYTRLAWEISPVLAIFLPVRLKNSEIIIKEVCGLVRLKPVPVMHIPEALQYLVTTDTLLNDVPEVNYSFDNMNYKFAEVCENLNMSSRDETRIFFENGRKNNNFLGKDSIGSDLPLGVRLKI